MASFPPTQPQKAETGIWSILLMFGLLATAFWLSTATFAQDPTESSSQEGILLEDGLLQQLVLGGELRLRAEGRDPGSPMTGTPSRNINTLRARVNVGLQFDEYLNGFFQLQESITAAALPATDGIHQAFLQADRVFGDYTVRAGRFEMAYGEGRMVDPDDWLLFSNTFDGAQAEGSWENLEWSAFYTHAVAGQGGFFTGDTEFHGAYGVWEVSPYLDLDTYILRRHDSTLNIDELTMGVRLVGEAFDGLLWNFEGAFQDGERGVNDVRAQAWVLSATYGLDGGHYVGLEWNMATGDDTPGDREDETFRAPFGNTHRFNGVADIVAWSNLVDLVARYWLVWNDRWTLHADFHYLQRQTTFDALYAGPGGPGLVGTRSDDIGGELDAYLVGSLSENLSVLLGGAYFNAGNGVRNSGDQVWLFGQLALRF